LPGAGHLPKLFRESRARSVHATLAIEDNSLDLDQINAVRSGTSAIGPLRDIREAENAFAAYEALPSWDPCSSKDLLAAHRLMFAGLAPDAGKFRTSTVNIPRGGQIAEPAPTADRVPALVEDLLAWLGQTEAHPLVSAGVCHLELESIHPFAAGNGRIARLWQALILSHWNPLFSFLPVESFMREQQAEYNTALNACDHAGNSIPFIELHLRTIRSALAEAAEAAS
jgi:Fic family protein